MEKVNNKYFKVKYLHKRLKAAGIENYNLLSNFQYKWLDAMEKRGRLVCPRGGIGMRTRLFTKEQVDEIIESFKPGSSGHWSYLDKK